MHILIKVIGMCPFNFVLGRNKGEKKNQRKGLGEIAHSNMSNHSIHKPEEHTPEPH